MCLQDTNSSVWGEEFGKRFRGAKTEKHEGGGERETEGEIFSKQLQTKILSCHLISSAEKLTMVGMKFSLMMMERICFQSVVLSPRSKQIDSRASFTAAGGLAMERTSTRCCFLMDLTAINIR